MSVSGLLLTCALSAGAAAVGQPVATSTPAARVESVTPAANRIEFRVRTKRGQGKVRCGLFAEPKKWLKDRGYAFKFTASIEGRNALCVFADVPAGRYAISAYHDRNDNGRFDRNMFGLPAEDFAFSSGARAGLGPPGFDDADFDYGGGVLVLDAEM